MKRCEKCNVFVNTLKKTCPLCAGILKDNELDNYLENEVIYPTYKPKNKGQNLVLRLMSFISIICSVVSIIVNYYEIKDTLILDGRLNLNITTLWSAIVVWGILLVNVLVKYTILSKDNFAKRLNTIFIVSAIEVVIVDYVLNGVYTYSLNYVVPFIFIANLLTLLIMVLIKKNLFSKFFSQILFVIFISILSCLMLVFNVVSVQWPMLSLTLFGAFTFIGLFLICPKQTKKEFKKRLHI